MKKTWNLTVLSFLAAAWFSAAAQEKKDVPSPVLRAAADELRLFSPPVPSVPAGCTTVLWDNGPFSFVVGVASEENTLVPSARSADDFVLTQPARLQAVTFDIITSTGPDRPGAVAFYADAGGMPADAPPLAVYTSSSFTVIGSFSGSPVRRYTVTLSPPLDLPPGRYWLSGYVIGAGLGRAFWGTSTGLPSGPAAPSYFRSVFFGYPVWTPVADLAPGVPPGFSFTICGDTRVNVNSQVQLLLYPTGNAALLGCPGYTNRLLFAAQLTNLGATPIIDPAVQVRGLGFPDLTNPAQVIVAAPNPHRLASADDFTGCFSGGLAGALQTTLNGSPPLGGGAPLPSVPPGGQLVFFLRVHCPTPQLPVRLLLDVLGRPTPGPLGLRGGEPSSGRSFHFDVTENGLSVTERRP